MTEWLPTARLLRLRVAAPPVSATGLPDWPSTLNDTWPLGVSGVVPPTVGATVATNATDCPNTDGLGAEPRLVVVSDVTVIVAVAVCESAVASALAGPSSEALAVKVAVTTPSTNWVPAPESEPFTGLPKIVAAGTGNGARPSSDPGASGVVEVPVTPNRSAVRVVWSVGASVAGNAMLRSSSQSVTMSTGAAPKRLAPPKPWATVVPGPSSVPHQLSLAVRAPGVVSSSTLGPRAAELPTNRLRLMSMEPASSKTAPPRGVPVPFA